jgi:hypothetical protein
MKIELLYFDGCPSWKPGLANLKSALELEGLEVPVDMVRVEDEAGATDLKFLGSPSFHVNGVEFWPEEREEYALNCRVYSTPEGLKGWPTLSMLRNKLQVLKEGS